MTHLEASWSEANPFGMESLMLERQPPWAVARMVSLGICAMTAVALTYAWLMPVDIVVSAQGRIIPSGRSKVVQPFETGVVKTIAVRDGQAVKAGDLLLALDTTATQSDRDRIQRELWESEAETWRLQSMMAGAPRLAPASAIPADILSHQQALLSSRQAEQHLRLASLDADIARREADRDAIAVNLEQLRNSLPLVMQKNEMREALAKTGYIAQTGLIETRLELISTEKEIAIQGNRLNESKAALNAAVQQRSQAQAEYRSRTGAELLEAVKKRDGARQELVKATQRSDLQTLRSPIDGIIQQLAVTTVGGVVTSAQPLMTIVPADAPLEVEAQVLNRDIGHVRVGQRVINKIETFDFTRYGYIEGTVLWVGTDAVPDPKQGPVYPVRIQLATSQTPTMVNGRMGVVSAGMNVSSDIRSGERRLLEYFLAPMLRYKQEALRER